MAAREPGYLEGYGVIDAEQVRQLAQDATLRLIEEPSVSPAEAIRYRAECGSRALGADARHDVPLPRLRPSRGDLRCRPHRSV